MLVVIALVAAAWVAPAAAQTVVFGVGGELSGQQGNSVRVPIYVDMRGAPGVKLGAYRVRLQWDPAVLQLYDYTTDVQPGRFGEPVLDADSAYSSGILKIGGLAAGGVDGLFDLFTIQFSVLGTGTSTVTLTVTEAVAAGTFADLLPFVTVLSGTYCPSTGRWGDLDGDGQANSRDALAILSAIVGLTPPAGFTVALGDVDGSGAVNSRDALITLSYTVGLDIPGQRVLVIAPGACGTVGPNTITLLPDAVDVVVGQRVQLLLLASAGGVPSAASASWATGDPAVASVSTEGVLAGAQPGTTTVTAALGPGIRATVPVTVRARRNVWHVDATKATFAAVQLGTVAYPFSSPEFAFPLVAEGDTVLVAPGTHDLVGVNACYNYGLYCNAAPGPVRSIVLMGDTLPDGTRPVLRGNPEASEGVVVDRSLRLEVRHLVFTNFGSAAIWYDQYYGSPTAAPGANAAGTVDRTLVLENVRIENVRYGGGVYAQGLDTLRIRGSEFACLAPETVYCYQPVSAGYIGLTDIQASRFLGGAGAGYYYYYRAEIYDGDSVVARDNAFLGLTGLYGDSYGALAGTALYAKRNRFSDEGATESAYSYYAGIDGYDLRSAVLDSNEFDYRFPDDYAIRLYGRYPARPGSFARLFGDSIASGTPGQATYGYWFDVEDFDSIAVDALKATTPSGVAYPYGGYMYARRVRVAGSKFLGSHNPLEIGADTAEVVNSQFTTCSGCASAGSYYGLEVYPYADSTRLLRVTGSSFSGFGYGAYLLSAVTVMLRANRFSGGSYGVYHAGSGALTLDSNVIAGTTTYAVYAGGTGSITARWNNIKNNAIGVYTTGTGTRSFTDGRFVGNTGQAVYASGVTVTATNNYWGSAQGPPASGANSVFGTVTTSPFLDTDPEGVSVPVSPPALSVLATGVRSGAQSAAGLEQPSASPLRALLDRQARREEVLRRREEARVRAKERIEELRSKQPR